MPSGPAEGVGVGGFEGRRTVCSYVFFFFFFFLNIYIYIYNMFFIFCFFNQHAVVYLFFFVLIVCVICFVGRKDQMVYHIL